MAKKKSTPEKVELILDNTRSSLAIENLYPTKGTEEITRQYLLGKISEEEAVRLIESIIPDSNRLESKKKNDQGTGHSH